MCTEIYPNLQSMFASQESVNPTATVANITTSFENFQVDTTEDTSEQLNQNRHNSINNSCDLLENRMIENLRLRNNNLRKHLRLITAINCIMIALTLAAVSFLVVSIVVTPFCIIGLALSILLLWMMVKYEDFETRFYNDNVSRQYI